MKRDALYYITAISLLLFSNVNFGQVINLGTASNFVLFTNNGAVGNSGASTFTGNIGSNAGAISGFGSSSVNGSFNNADAITAQVKIDLLNAYNQLISIAVTNTIHTPAFGGGETLTAGVYAIAGAGSLAGNLTLDGLGDTSAVFIFKFGGAYAIGAASSVVLINGARSCNLFWVAEGAISLAASTTMIGTLIANNAAISMAASGNLEGRLFSTTGAVAFGPAIAYVPSCINTTSISPIAYTINMGTIEDFALFTSSGAVSNTGNSLFKGNIGSNLGSISGFGTSTVTGSFNNADAVTAQAKLDLQTIYNQLTSIPTTNTTHAPAFGGGEILPKGIYAVGGAGSILGNLILDAQGDSNAVFIFKIGGAFTTAASSKVCLINRALPCKVFWVVEGAIAMAASTTMKGMLIANNAAISMAAGGDLQGRMLSTSGAVSFGPGSAYTTCQRSYTWASTGNTLFSQPSNWNPTGNPGCTCMDNVFYNNLSSVNCDFDQAVSVSNFSVMTGYTGIINAQTNGLIVNSDYGQASGVFSGSTHALFLYGNYLLSGGIFNSTSGILTAEGGIFSNTAGTFNHNSGTVIYNRTSALPSAIISGTFLFNRLEFTSSGNSTERLVNFNTSINTASLTLNGGATAFGYEGNIAINTALIINGTSTSTLTLNTGTFTIIGSGAKTINGTIASDKNLLGTIIINTIGNLSMSNHINVGYNWIHQNVGVFTSGTSTVNIIGTGTIISGTTTSTSAYFDNLCIATSSTLNINGHSHINIGADLTDNGVLNANSSLIRLNGLAAQAINGSSTLTTINALEITDVGNKSLLHPINILDSVKINKGTLASGTGNLILKSNALLKARIAEITGGTGAITGTVTVETFALGNTTDWAVLGSSGVSGLTIANWEGQIPMSCSLCPNNEMSAGGYFVSVQGWNELALAGSSLAYLEMNYNSPLTVGQGYWVYLGNGLTSTSDITYSVSGPVVTGNTSLALTHSGAANGDGYNLISNPYASPISWTKLRNGNTAVDNAIYAYNADLGITTSYVNGVSTPAMASVNDVIPMGQGFYVCANTATNLLAQESNKVSYNTSAHQLLKTVTNTQVFRLRVDGFDGYSDETVIRFEPSASTNFDTEWDAYKIYASPGYLGYPGAWNKRTSIATQSYNVDYSINSLPTPSNQDLIMPVIVRVYQSGLYTISPIDVQNLPSTVCAQLFDKVTHITHDLRSGSFSCSINDTTTQARFVLTICGNTLSNINVAENKAFMNSITINSDATGLMINLDFSQETQTTISVTNIFGQRIIKDLTIDAFQDAVHIDINSTNELVFVTVSTNKVSVTKKIIR